MKEINYGKLFNQSLASQVRIFDAYYNAVMGGDATRAAKARRMLKAAERRYQRRLWAKYYATEARPC